MLPQLRADEWLFGWLTGGQVPTVWLQEHLYVAGDVQWYDVMVVPVYMSHFLVPMALAVALWLTRYELFRRYVWTLVTLTLHDPHDVRAVPGSAAVAGRAQRLPARRRAGDQPDARGDRHRHDPLGGRPRRGLRERRRRDPVAALRACR